MVAMVYTQLSGAASLRHVVDGLHSHANRLYHLGVEPARRSSLADANRNRPADVFADLLFDHDPGSQRGTCAAR